MRRRPPIFFAILIIFFLEKSTAQVKSYTPRLETCACAFKADSTHKTTCAYLIVPENRNNPTGKTIKLPFIVVESNNPNKRHDPVLYTAGGPGASSLGGVRFIQEREFIKNRDYIAFEQRGTWYAQPRLNCPEVSEAIKESYRKGLNRDSLVLEAVKACRKRLEAQGIDLSAYNTIENAADIEDLRETLHIDSLNLLGISYSGGLMLTVVRNFQAHLRSVVLDSPLPGFLNYEEFALSNINQALDHIFDNCERDSSNKALYGNLRQQFRNYFISIAGQAFYFNYKEKDHSDSIRIRYTRNELIDVLTNDLSNNSRLKDLPFLITQLIHDIHQPYIRHYFDDIFAAGDNANGMRYSVYCSEQIAFANQSIIDQENDLFPWLAGYRFNNVTHQICNCWNVKPEPPVVKTPVLSNIPVLLGAGDTDPWCRPIFIDFIHQYLPNSWRLLFTDKTHAPLLSTSEGDELIAKFFDDPMQKIMTDDKKVLVY